MVFVNNTLFSPLSAAAILAMSPKIPEWVWNTYIALGDLFAIAAFMKVGKSTLYYLLAIAVARGADFLGRPTKQGGVLIVPIEEKPGDVYLRLKS